MNTGEFTYPSREDLESFANIIKNGNYSISKYLPSIDEDWLDIISDCITYVQTTAHYEPCGIHECASRLLYKVAKRHELGDGNKRSSVIVVNLFSILNDHWVTDPRLLKDEAKRAARSKGRENEELIRSRIANELESVIRKV